MSTAENKFTYPDRQNGEYTAYARLFFKHALSLTETKFPLETHFRMGTEVRENQIITDDDGVFNILYLPFNIERADKEEQIKISNDKEKTTVIIKNDPDHPEITYELFEINGSEPERKIASETNTPESVYRASKMLGKLSSLEFYDISYCPTL